MRNNRLFFLLKGLEKQELKLFTRFLSADYHCTNDRLMTLYKQLEKYFPDFSATNVSSEKLHQKVFPEKTFESRRLTDLMSDLSLLLEEFFAIEEVKRNVATRKNLTVQAMGKRNIHPLFERDAIKLIGETKKSNQKDAQYFLRLYELHHDLYFHPDVEKGKNHKLLEQGMEYLDDFAALEKLQIGYELRHNTASKKEPRLLHQAEAYANVNANKGVLFRIFPKLLELDKGASVEIFRELRDLFIDNLKSFNNSDRRAILTPLINYTVRETAKGEVNLDEETFNLYRLGVKERILIYDGRITDTSFTNIAVVASNIGEFDWAKAFVKKYQRYLEPSIKTDAIALSNAYIYYNEGRFDDAIEALIHINFSSFNYKFRGETIAIRCYYELFLENDNMYDLLINKVHAYQKYVSRRTNLPPNIKESVINFTKFAIRLAKLEINPNTTSKQWESIQDEINNKKYLIYRSFLRKKIKRKNMQQP